MMLSDILTDKDCFVCGSNLKTKVFELSHSNSNVFKMLDIHTDAHNQKSNVYQCKKCGHHYLSPVINSILMDKYYKAASEYYRKDVCPQNHLQNEHKSILKKIRAIRTSGKILEIGCGYGFLLDTLNKNGYEAFGIEPSAHAFEFAKNRHGLDVRNVLLEEAKYPEDFFDIVILFDVLEHIEDVNIFLCTIKKYLKKGGHLLIGTGDIDSFNARLSRNSWDYFSSWEHISFFSGKSIKYLLRQNGFRDVRIQRVSYKGSFFTNTKIIFAKIIKAILSRLLKKEYTRGALAFDHMLVVVTKG